MRLIIILFCLLTTQLATASIFGETHESNDLRIGIADPSKAESFATGQWVVHLKEGTDPRAFADTHRIRYVSSVNPLPGFHVFELHSAVTDNDEDAPAKRKSFISSTLNNDLIQSVTKGLAESSEVQWSEHQEARWRLKRTTQEERTEATAPARQEKNAPHRRSHYSYHVKKSESELNKKLLENEQEGVHYATKKEVSNREVKPFKNPIVRSDTSEQVKAHPVDPLFSSQWHLGGSLGKNVNARAAWTEGIGGKGVVIAVVDDGLQFRHPDLSLHYRPDLSWDFNENDDDPSPTLDDHHGTSVGGVCCASQNDVCGSGVAPLADIAGIRLIGGPVTDLDEATALSLHREEVDIYSCSWGPSDSGNVMQRPGHLLERILEEGTTKGRKGKGNIFVWAGGNGRMNGDRCSADGFVNSPYTIAVGAIARSGRQSWYSESCPALFVSVPSSGESFGITTTDLQGYPGYSSTDCTSTFGGTSSAAPLASGLIALMLEKHPEFTWRDVQHVIAKSAWKTDGRDSSWATNQRGYHHSERYGFGLLKAGEMLHYSDEHTLVPRQKKIVFPVESGRWRIPRGSFSYDLDDDSHHPLALPIEMESSEILFVEQVCVKLFLRHPKRGYVRVSLRSPEGIVSHFEEGRPDYTKDSPSGGWKYCSVRHWGEGSTGTWSLLLDDFGNYGPGDLLWYQIEFRGY